MDTRAILKNKIKPGRQRMTTQRMVILDELKKASSHPSAYGVYRMVQKKIPNISFGTVYRNLRLLEALELIQELNYGKEFSRYDGNSDNHYHISCERCGRVDDIPIGIWKRLDKEVARASRYNVKSHRMEFYGLCQKCHGSKRR